MLCHLIIVINDRARTEGCEDRNDTNDRDTTDCDTTDRDTTDRAGEGK
jgi:hypothetical protein